MKKLLWLDDSRDPLQNDWLNFSPIGKNVDVTWVMSYQEFTEWISLNGLPDAICFDHDLGDVLDPNADEKTGMSCANWLVNYCLDNNKRIPPYGLQSSNPNGRENIDCLLKNYIKNCEVDE
jgi:hypothetical protein